ncbi:unnamed protein product, partial [Staurois parvus]
MRGPGRPDIVNAGSWETRYSECRVLGDQIKTRYSECRVLGLVTVSDEISKTARSGKVREDRT